MLVNKKSKSNLVYLLIVPIFLTIFSACIFKSYDVSDQIKITPTNTDTIKGYLKVVDTVKTYNYKTYEETITIVENKVPIDDYIKKIKLSGKTYTMIDTVPAFDMETKKEHIKEITNKIPIELIPVYNRVRVEHGNHIILKYGSQTIRTIK